MHGASTRPGRQGRLGATLEGITNMARLGLFSTMTGAGSRELVATIAGSCRRGDLGDARVAFLFVNRDEGESAMTDASVAALAAEFGLLVVRASAVAFRTAERKAAREAAAACDDEALWSWRDAYYESYRERLPATDVDLLLGDMWIWGRRQCRERSGLNLHPALPTGPLGKMWFDVIWDLVAEGAESSGVMLHRVTPEVDRGPVATYCRYSLRGPEAAPLWASLPSGGQELEALIRGERLLKRQAAHPLFHALRRMGLAREMPLMLETARAVADGRLRLTADGIAGADGRPLDGGLDLTADVERAVSRAESRG